MCAFGGDLAPLQDYNLVGIEHRAYALGDDERGAIPHQFPQCGFDFGFCFHIYRAGAVIQNKDLRSHQKGAGDGDALLLTTGEVYSPLPQHGVVSMRERHDEFVGLGCFGRDDDLLVRRVRATVADVVADSAAEEHRLLQRDTYLSAQCVQWDVAHVHAIQRHPALFHVVETGNQVDQARFARTGGSQDGHRLPRFGHQVDPLKHRLVTVVVVAEADVLEGNAPGNAWQSLGLGAVLYLSSAIQHLPDALGRGVGGRERSNHASQHYQREERVRHVVD